MTRASHDPAGDGKRVGVVRTGTANLASVLAGLERIGMTPELVSDPTLVTELPFLVLPGVGAFRAAREELDRLELVEALRTRIERDLPTLCVCLGMQLLCESSAESPDALGLGIVPGRIERFPDTVRVPQLGWNRIEADPGAELLSSGHVYFANSYCLRQAPPGWNVAWSEHGGRFVAALERGRVLACQFHPELSGGFGRELLSRWKARGGVPC